MRTWTRHPDDLSGMRFGKLVAVKNVVEGVDHINIGRQRWLCKCDCGNEYTVSREALLDKSHPTKSCGCEPVNGRQPKDRLRQAWRNMKNRCYYEGYDSYPYYGGRGIGVCEEWLNDFKAFKKWALENGYEERLTLDRIDPNKDYGPDNCRWASWEVQGNNRRPRRWRKMPEGWKEPMVV